MHTRSLPIQRAHGSLRNIRSPVNGREGAQETVPVEVQGAYFAATVLYAFAPVHRRFLGVLPTLTLCERCNTGLIS